GNDGSVMVTVYALSDYYEFDVKPTGLITVAHEREQTESFYQEDMTQEQVLLKIKEFALQKWHTSDYSISASTTISGAGNLRVTPFETPPTKPASQSLKNLVQGVCLGVLASTQPKNTKQSRERRSSSGRSRRKR